MREVTEKSPYNKYPGRSIICTKDEAIDYVNNHCPPEEYITGSSETYDFFTHKLNRVWWTDTKFKHSDKGMKKIAQYSEAKNLLTVYIYKHKETKQ